MQCRSILIWSVKMLFNNALIAVIRILTSAARNQFKESYSMSTWRPVYFVLLNVSIAIPKWLFNNFPAMNRIASLKYASALAVVLACTRALSPTMRLNAERSKDIVRNVEAPGWSVRKRMMKLNVSKLF